MAQLKKIAAQPEPPRLVVQGDLLMKEVALASEPKNTLQFTLATLLTYYQHQIKVLPHKKCKLLFRWARYCQSAEILSRCEPIFKARVRHIEAEYEATQERIERLGTYMQQVASSRSVGKWDF